MTGYEQQDPSSGWDQGQAAPPGQGPPPDWNASGGQWNTQQGGPYGTGGPQYGTGGPQYGTGGPQYGTGGPQYGTGGPYGTGGGQQPPTAIKTYRTQAIIIVVCSVLFGLLGLITGIPALIYSTRVTESLSRGDFMQAVNASRRARVLCWISVGIIALVWLIIIIAAVASGHNSNVTNTGNTGNT